MITLELEIDDLVKEYNVPTEWNDVTVEQFCKLYSLQLSGKSSIERMVIIASVFTDIEPESLFMLSQEQFNEFSTLIGFINTEMVDEFKETVDVDGETYYIKRDFESLSVGEVISIEVLVEKSDGNILKCMDELLCIFLRKKKDNGKLEAFKNEFMLRKDIFKKVKIVEVNSIFSAFLTGRNSL